jgi:hypothetical protein
MHPTDELIPILKKLRMSGVLGTLELRTRQATGECQDSCRLDFHAATVSS